MASWTELFTSLYRALVDVARAEIAELGKDLAASGRRLGSALGLLALAAGLSFLLIGALVFAAIAALSLALPPWGAALAVAGALALAVLVLAILGVRRLRALESPATTIRRHVQDHVAWWEGRLVLSEGRPDEAEETD